MGKLAARIVLWADSSCCLEVFLYIYYNFFFSSYVCMFLMFYTVNYFSFVCTLQVLTDCFHVSY